MAVQLEEKDGGRILHVTASGRLTKNDYAQFVPELERLMQQHGRIRLLFEMRDFRGWTASALWEDLKFDVAHFRDIERLAMVGDKAWERGMAVFCRPFTTAEIRYFDRSEADAARSWIGLEPDRAASAS